MTDLLLDTNILAMSPEGGHRRSSRPRQLVTQSDSSLSASVVKFWEMAINYRSGKLVLGSSIENVTDVLKASGVALLPLEDRHAIPDPELSRAAADQFDRMILAIAEQKQMTLPTTDKSLLNIRWCGVLDPLVLARH